MTDRFHQTYETYSALRKLHGPVDGGVGTTSSRGLAE